MWSLTPIHWKMYLVQLYKIKFISYQHQVNGFLWVSPISIVKLDSHPCYSVLHSTLWDKVYQLPTSGQWFSLGITNINCEAWLPPMLQCTSFNFYKIKLISYQHQANGFLWVSPISIVKFNSHPCYSVLHSTFTR